MIDKKILWLGGGGAVAISVAIAITINVVIKNPARSDSNHLNCTELQQAIDHLGNVPYSKLPASITVNIAWLNTQSGICNFHGHGWQSVVGRSQNEQDIIGHETTNTTDGMDMGNLKFHGH